MTVRELRYLLFAMPNQDMEIIAALQTARSEGWVGWGQADEVKSVAAELSRSFDRPETLDQKILRLAVAFARASDDLEILGIRVNDWARENVEISEVEIVEGGERRRLRVKP
jgi:hypothetical protein